MSKQLRHRQHSGPKTLITRIDLKGSPFDDLAGIRLVLALLDNPHHDATIDRLPAGSISPSKQWRSISHSAQSNR
jgi:hypothetical protein